MVSAAFKIATRAASSRGLPVLARPAGAAAARFFPALSIIALQVPVMGNAQKLDIDSCCYHRNDTYGIETMRMTDGF
jgi:hypothetical protein